MRYSRCSYLRDFVGNDVKIPFFILAATEMKICCCKQIFWKFMNLLRPCSLEILYLMMQQTTDWEKNEIRVWWWKTFSLLLIICQLKLVFHGTINPDSIAKLAINQKLFWFKHLFGVNVKAIENNRIMKLKWKSDNFLSPISGDSLKSMK